MSLIILALLTCTSIVATAGLTLAVYSSLPEEFLTHADEGRYAGLATGPASTPATDRAPLHNGSLQDQSV